MIAWVRLRPVTEHMEEDDNTPKALPDWVELEYKVSDVFCHENNNSTQPSSSTCGI